jgi:hypothetical protein
MQPLAQQGYANARGNWSNHKMERDSADAHEAQSMLLEQKKVQDSVTALVQHIPSVLYVFIALVYTITIFIVRESVLFPVWAAFSSQLIMVWGIFRLRAIMAYRIQRFYETVALRRPSASYSTDGMMWADRLAELRQFRKHEENFTILQYIEPLLWLAFSLLVYFLARRYS